MDKEKAEKIIEGTAQKLLEESQADNLYIKVKLRDLDSAKELFILSYKDNAFGDGIDIEGLDWGVQKESLKLYDVRSELLKMVKDIRPLDYTEYE